MSTAIKERPVIFSDAMVRAILAGRKTQTRRVIKPQPDNPDTFGISPIWGQGVPRNEDRFCIHAAFNESGRRVDKWLPCPYGKPGDRLWVRECWATDIHNNQDSPDRIRELCEEAGYAVDSTHPAGPVWYRADDSRWASRLLLEVKSVRVERVQEISEEDAIAEGVDSVSIDDVPRQAAWSRRQDFSRLWDSINGTRTGCAWADNPWVWVVEFERVNDA